MLISCDTHIETIYTYNGITIRRVDSSQATTYFYYMDENKTIGCIWFEYSGMNNFFRSYLVFNDDKSVDIVGDYCESDIQDTSKFSVKKWQEEINGKVVFYSLDDSARGNGHCIYSCIKCEPQQNMMWDGGLSEVKLNCKGGYDASWGGGKVQPFIWKNGSYISGGR